MRNSSQRNKQKRIYGLYYNRHFLSLAERSEILHWLQKIYPIWENRFSKNNPPPADETQRQLLRPVYWLGNWQFACLDYYHPPKGIDNRCVEAEAFPLVLKEICKKAESISKKIFKPNDLPKDWTLNTCLINLYGDKLIDGKMQDCARVGEHKDFEPGPVASLSIGERAMFQFVSSRKKGSRDSVVLQQWLDDGSLQIFGGEKWKNKLFHRVQRVDRRENKEFCLNVPNEKFQTRRINFTFRYVPKHHIVPFSKLPSSAKEDVLEYVEKLAEHSSFFAKIIKQHNQ